MKKQILIATIAITAIITGCATVQSIIKSTFPYTATLVVPASKVLNTPISATSSASSFDQILGNQNGANLIKEVRVVSASLTSINPSSQNLGVIKSAKLFIGNGDKEIMVASRNDIGNNVGNNLVLDIDNTKFVDDYIKSSNVRIRLEYTLSSEINLDFSVRASVSFNSTPVVN